MSENSEIAESLRALAFKLENPRAFSVACHKEVVAVALRFVRWADPSMSENEIAVHIMHALGGKANPQTLRDEIARQRKA